MLELWLMMLEKQKSKMAAQAVGYTPSAARDFPKVTYTAVEVKDKQAVSDLAKTTFRPFATPQGNGVFKFPIPRA